jgi:hypothetical protein
MRNLLLIVVFVASSICASAQKVYFIYLQSENNNPFYIKMGDKIYSSATSGYLILSNLVDSTYNFSIGFPSSQTESKFIVAVGGKDRGFLIKNFESGLGLFDLQNLTITNALKDDSPKNISYIRRNDDFSSLLAKAAKDTTLLYAVVRLKEEDMAIKMEELKTGEPKQKVEETTLQKDTVAANGLQTDIASGTKKPDTVAAIQSNQEIKKEENVVNTSVENDLEKDTLAFVGQKEQPKQVMPDTANLVSNTVKTGADTAIISAPLTEDIATFKRSRIKKHSESSTSEGFGLVYYDIYDDGRDTIRLLIPNPPIIFKQPDQDSSLVQKDFIHIDDLKKDTVEQTPIIVAVKNNAPVKSQCKSIASSNDFFKLRKNMAAENTDEAMVAEAKKFFKSKCFTTEQVKNLSALFLTSAGKYQFFDAAYLHVNDQEQFSTLESEIKDDYYLKRFKALIGE